MKYCGIYLIRELTYMYIGLHAYVTNYVQIKWFHYGKKRKFVIDGLTCIAHYVVNGLCDTHQAPI